MKNENTFLKQTKINVKNMLHTANDNDCSYQSSAAAKYAAYHKPYSENRNYSVQCRSEICRISQALFGKSKLLALYKS